ncbi:MAG: HEAT repeat domain-containing protein [Myxococcota bacterium]
MRARIPSLERFALVAAHCVSLLGVSHHGGAHARSELQEGAAAASAASSVEGLAPTATRRYELRRGARSDPDASVRAAALRSLAQEDPTVATGRICVRALRADEAPSVRRAAAECLGQLPLPLATSHTAALIGALQDEHVDVVTMAAWALGRVGDPAARVAVLRLRTHPDSRGVTLAAEYEALLVARHGALTQPTPSTSVQSGADDELARRAQVEARAQTRAAEVLASAAWLSVFGGMSGWVYGGMLGAAHLGDAGAFASLGALGGALGGAAAGGAFALGRRPSLLSGLLLSELAAFGGIAGYGLAALASAPAQRGKNLANFSATGALLGTGLALVVDRGNGPLATRLAAGLGATVGTGTAAGLLVFGVGGDAIESAASALLAGGSAGLLAVVVSPRAEEGVTGWMGAVLGGSTLACISGLVVASMGQYVLPQEAVLRGTALATVAGGASGALAGTLFARRVLQEHDPFLAVAISRMSPRILFALDRTNMARALPLLGVGGVL